MKERRWVPSAWILAGGVLGIAAASVGCGVDVRPHQVKFKPTVLPILSVSLVKAPPQYEEEMKATSPTLDLNAVPSDRQTETQDRLEELEKFLNKAIDPSLNNYQQVLDDMAQVKGTISEYKVTETVKHPHGLVETGMQYWTVYRLVDPTIYLNRRRGTAFFGANITSDDVEILLNSQGEMGKWFAPQAQVMTIDEVTSYLKMFKIPPGFSEEEGLFKLWIYDPLFRTKVESVANFYYYPDGTMVEVSGDTRGRFRFYHGTPF